jgi:hypothetical protein
MIKQHIFNTFFAQLAIILIILPIDVILKNEYLDEAFGKLYFLFNIGFRNSLFYS